MLHDDIHVVLDEQKGHAPIRPQRFDVLQQAASQRRVDAGHRLVQEDHRRLGHQRARQLEELALSTR